MARWQSGDAEDCKSLYGGSIPSEVIFFGAALNRPRVWFARARERGCQCWPEAALETSESPSMVRLGVRALASYSHSIVPGGLEVTS